MTPRKREPTRRGDTVSELGIVYLFLGLLALFVIIGALLPKYLPGLMRKLDTTVLNENKDERGGRH